MIQPARAPAPAPGWHATMSSSILWPIHVIAAVLAAWALSLIWRGAVGVRRKAERRCPACDADMQSVKGRTCPACSHLASTERRLHARCGQSLADVALGVLAMAGAVGVLVSKALARMWVGGGAFTVDWTELVFQCLFGGFVAMAIWTVALAIRGDRSRGRARCPHCWYSMDGVDSLQCPECGREAPGKKALFRTRRRWRRAAALAAVFLLIAGATWCVPTAIKHGVVALVPTRVLVWAMPWAPPGWLYNPAEPEDDFSLAGRMNKWDEAAGELAMSDAMRMRVVRRVCLLLPRMSRDEFDERIFPLLDNVYYDPQSLEARPLLTDEAIHALWSATGPGFDHAWPLVAGLLESFPEATHGRDAQVADLVMHESADLQRTAVVRLFHPENPTPSTARHLARARDLMFQTRDRAVQFWATRGLAERVDSNPEIAEDFERIMASGDLPRIHLAVNALGRVQTPKACDLLVLAVENPDPQIATVAATHLLHDFGDSDDAVAAVQRRLLREEAAAWDLVTRIAARETLCGLFAASLLPPPDDDTRLARIIEEVAKANTYWSYMTETLEDWAGDTARPRRAALARRVLERTRELESGEHELLEDSDEH